MNRGVSLLLAFIFTAVVLAPAAAHAVLLAHWTADGTTNDVIAGRNGTLQNGATFDTGILGQSFRLDGVNDFVSVADDPIWTLGNSDFTIALWANFDVIKAGPLGAAPNTFIAHDTGPGPTNKWIFTYDDDGPLAWISDPLSPTFSTSPSSFVPTLGQWHHLAITRTGSSYTFYADGSSLGTAIATGSLPDPNAPLTIGQAEGLGFFDGRLDEIRIYKDEALSAAQVSALASVPEPSTALLLGTGLILLQARHRRSKRCS